MSEHWRRMGILFVVSMLSLMRGGMESGFWFYFSGGLVGLLVYLIAFHLWLPPHERNKHNS